ncbi:hypothetical protein AGMMS49546_36700 [Spirochaetia bacterium]|nr:hypothetical protein AGMMS49546_36700 [Spirochaetia bacterium]
MAFEVDKFDTIVYDHEHYIIGHAKVTKEKCEIYNFVSNTFRILHFLDGSAEWKIGNEIYTFHPGDIIIFNNLIKRNIHRVLTKDITYEFFDFYPFCLTDKTLRNFFYGTVYKVASAADQTAQTIYFLFDNLKQEMKKKSDGFQIFSIQRYLDLMVLEFYRNVSAHELKANSSLNSISGSIQYIQQHLNEKLSVAGLADLCGYSPEYFARIFKKIIGLSPKSYIISLRLEKTLHLVSTENMTILDAAFESGFKTSSAFYKSFNAYKSTSPLKYLKNIP